MRARRDLAEALVAAGQVEEGMSHLEEMLKLNCNDNQGVRDLLFGLYLECGKLEAARELFKRYSESVSAVFLWSRALERFLVGKREEALIAARVAHARNRFVKDFLTGAEEKPLAPPESYSPGKQSEALYAVWCIGRAWEKNSQAATWLEKAVW
jgi:tetratricopeptide (TPR) repeat protein